MNAVIYGANRKIERVRKTLGRVVKMVLMSSAECAEICRGKGSCYVGLAVPCYLCECWDSSWVRLGLLVLIGVKSA